MDYNDNLADVGLLKKIKVVGTCGPGMFLFKL